MEKNLYIVCGHSNAGKTNFLKEAVKLFKEKGITLGGVIAPGVWDGDEKTGIDSILFPSEELVHLAVRKPDFSEGYSRKWKFDEKLMDKINKHLGDLSNCDYVMIDEIGPLEIIKKQGFTNALKIIETAKFDNVIVAIRPSLVERLKDMAHKDYKITLIEVDKNPDINILL